MTRPPAHVVDAIAPLYATAVDLPVHDSGLRNVAHAEPRDTMRLPRGGDYDATLVAVKRYYDGLGGGEAGHYVLLFVEFRYAGTRWRSPGVKVRAEEAKRVAGALRRGKPSSPGRGESARAAGQTGKAEESTLRGQPVESGGEVGYLLFVRHRDAAGEWARTRGVVVLSHEVPAVAAMLGALAAAASDKKEARA